MNAKTLAATGLLAMGLGACGAATEPSAGPTPPAEETWTEDEWTVTTPGGWTRSDITDKADAEKAVRYRAADGRYFIVAIDPMGSDYAYDALWQYRVTGRGFEVVEKTDCAGTKDRACVDDDARFDGWVLWETGTEPVKVGGHVWYFMFGDTDGTSVDAAAFEQIVESVRAA